MSEKDATTMNETMNETMAARMIRFLYLKLWLDQCVPVAEDLASIAKAAVLAGDGATFEVMRVTLWVHQQRAQAYGAALTAELAAMDEAVSG